MSTQTANNHTFSGEKIPKATKRIFPWVGIFRDACYALVGTFLIQYALTAGVLSSNAETFKTQYGIITIAMIIALVWDGINDPIMGFILEKCHFKSGKFRPWIEIGAVGNAVIVALMFLIPSLFMVGGDGWAYVIFMIIGYFLWDLFFTINDIGYWSMLPSLTNDDNERGKLTTQTTIAASIGTFIMNVSMFILPGLLTGVSTAMVYMWTGIITAILFLLSQTAIFVFCKERERDPEQEKISEESHILDLFRVVIKNKQLLAVAIAMLLCYFGQFILTGIGQNYYYLLYGYGGSNGGMIATIVSVIYILGTIAGQAIYPVISKKISRKKLLAILAIITIAGYLLYFLVGFPLFGDEPLASPSVEVGTGVWYLSGTMFLIYLLTFIVFASSGMFYLALMVMFQDAIDYNEWKYGERKESICFAWRPLDVKLASGLNRGLQYIVYFATGTYVAINAISNAESQYNADVAAGMDGEVAEGIRDSSIGTALAEIENWQLILFGVIVVGVIILCFLGSWLIMKFCYKIDEDMQQQMKVDLDAKREKYEAELASQAVLATADGGSIDSNGP